MSPEHQRSNLESWDSIASFIEEFPDDAHWTPWKILARQFFRDGCSAGLNRYFRAGQSMSHLIFSTLDHHGIRDEPFVTVVFHPDSELRIAYGTTNLHFRAPEFDYTLAYDDGFATFRRALNQLWSATVPEPVPEELRGSFTAPILTSERQLQV